VPAVVQQLVVAAVVVLLMLAAGLRVDRRDVVEAISRRGLLARVLAANVLGVPVVAATVVTLAGAPSDVAGGVILCAIAPGGPFAPVLAGIARADVEASVGLMLVLALTGVVTAPVGVGVFGLDAAGLGPGLVLRTVLVCQIVPLAVGMGLRAAAPARALAAAVPVGRLANVCLGLVIGWLVVVRGDVLAATGLPALGWMTVVAAASLVLGRTMSRRAAVARAAALCTGIRNLALALLVASLDGVRAGLGATVLAFGAVMLGTCAITAVTWGCRRTVNDGYP
jgi:BASS family bile acid:Na+ symporter